MKIANSTLQTELITKGGNGSLHSQGLTPVSFKIELAKQNRSHGLNDGSENKYLIYQLVNGAHIQDSIIENGSKYEIIEEIESGGMGTVYKAKNLSTNEIVAIKVLKPGTHHENLIRRFEREARALAGAQHQNIVKIYDYGTDKVAGPFIVEEFLVGKTLEKAIIEYLDNPSKDSLMKMLDYISKISGGLAYIHDQGIYHRDMKPSNVIIVNDNKPVIIDFGLALINNSSFNTSLASIKGTPLYIAPEQVSGEEITCATDLYATGIMLYLIASSKHPFSSTSNDAGPNSILQRQVNERPVPPSELPNIPLPLPTGLEGIILKLLEKDPHNRYQDGKALAYDLQRMIKLIRDESSNLDLVRYKSQLLAV